MIVMISDFKAVALFLTKIVKQKNLNHTLKLVFQNSLKTVFSHHISKKLSIHFCLGYQVNASISTGRVLIL